MLPIEFKKVRSLGFKFSLAITIIIFLVVSLISIFFLSQERKALESELEKMVAHGKSHPPQPKLDKRIADKVKKPSHYHFFGEDSMPMIEKILGTEGYLGFLKGNALKYRIRCGKKKGNNVVNEINKALYYEELYNTFVMKNRP